MPFTLPIGATAPNFSLPATDGKAHGLSDFRDAEILIIFFTCNHCPFVTNSDEYIGSLATMYKSKNVQFVGINSNSKNTYEEDSFENMIKRMERYNFPWKYLHDESQEVALSYGALNTPHYFVFDKSRYLIYTGRALDNPQNPEGASVYDLERVLEEYFADEPISITETNPIGCNVKWDGKGANWVPPEACDLVATY